MFILTAGNKKKSTSDRKITRQREAVFVSLYLMAANTLPGLSVSFGRMRGEAAQLYPPAISPLLK